MDAVVCENRVDLVGDGLDECFEKIGRRLPIGSVVQLGVDEFGRPIDGHEEVELTFLGPHFGDVDVEIADGIGLELLLGRFVPFRLRQPADGVTLKTAMKG